MQDLTKVIVKSKSVSQKTRYIPTDSHKSNFLDTLGIDVDCYVFNDGKAIVYQKSMATALGLKSEGGSALKRILSRESLCEFIKA